MTYCVAIKVNAGLACISDTRTNAGMDNVARFKKTFTWSIPGERALILMTAGNLSITQSLIASLNQPDEVEKTPKLLRVKSMFEAAQLVGDTLLKIQNRYGPTLRKTGEDAGATVLLGGQIRDGEAQGGEMRLFRIYATGNFIEAGDDTPFFQLGEHKYGKPLLDRMVHQQMPLPTARLVALLSMNSTIRSNLSVGEPLDITLLPQGSYDFTLQQRVDEHDPEYAMISSGWSQALADAVQSLSDQLDKRNQQAAQQ